MAQYVLNRPTLVLNRNWQPVAVATVARALIKVWTDTARVVDPASYQLYDWQDWSKLRPAENELSIRVAGGRDGQASGFRLRVPEVIFLNHFDKTPNANVAFSRRNIFKRDRFTCQYCGRQPGVEELTIDHVTPRSQGGVTSWENCVLACLNCNSVKADRTPDQARMRLRTDPQKPRWKPLYAAHDIRIASWSKFISEAYWNAQLE